MHVMEPGGSSAVVNMASLAEKGCSEFTVNSREMMTLFAECTSKQQREERKEAAAGALLSRLWCWSSCVWGCAAPSISTEFKAC